MVELGPGAHLDQFEIVDVLAKSGMATLFRARDTTDGRSVVLKVPHLEYASDLVFHERFRREEQMGQRLSHPGVTRVLEPRDKSRLYLAMEYVPGESLRHRLAREGRLPVDEAVRIAIAIADALEYLHGAGIVHRDLKPDNVMLLPGGGVKLLDLGIALDRTQRRIEWAGLSGKVGTPEYMAPEQQQGKPGDERTDLYALGMILYEMLAGERPVMNGGPPPAVRDHRPEVSPALERVVLRALEHDPARRPERALELRDELAHPPTIAPVGAPAPRAGLDARLGRGGRLVLLVAAVLAYALLMFVLTHAPRPGAGGAPSSRAPAGPTVS
jgi:eukaryotic-like serine/threonine-protein kinase